MAKSELNLLPAGFQLEEDPDEKFNKAAEFTFAQEGGYMVDKGRPTNFGIRQDILDSFNEEEGNAPMSVTDLTPDDARYVAKKAFFFKPGFDKLPANTATVLFDYGFNSGPRTAIKALQKTVGANPDGSIGPKTLKATQDFIKKNGEKALLQKITDQRQQNYNRLLKDPSNHQWKNGWNNRIKKIKDTFDLAMDAAGQGIDTLIGTGTAYADELPPEEQAILPEGFQLEGSAQAPASSPSPAQAARVALAARGLPVLSEKPPASVADAIEGYQPPPLPDASQLPEGFSLEDQISQGKKPSLMDKIQGAFSKPPEQRQAEAANIYAISKSTGLDPLFVEKNYDKISKDSSVTGLTHQIDNVGQLAMAAGAPFMVAGAIEAPIATAAGMAAFTLLDHVIDLNKFVPSDANDTVKSTVEAVDFIGKALATHGVFKTAPKLAEAFTKQKLTEFKLPTEVKLSGAQVRDIYQTGKLTTPEQVQLYAGLNLSREQVKNALANGVDITIPTSKIVTLTDKPWWAKVKGAFGMASQATTKTTMAGVPKPAVSALPAPKDVLPAKPEVMTPQARAIVTEAEKHGTVVGIDAGSKLPIIDTSKPVSGPASPAPIPAPQAPEVKPATPIKESKPALPVEAAPAKTAIEENINLVRLQGLGPRIFKVLNELPKQSGDLPNEKYFEVQDIKNGEKHTVESSQILNIKKTLEAPNVKKEIAQLPEAGKNVKIAEGQEVVKVNGSDAGGVSPKPGVSQGKITLAQPEKYFFFNKPEEGFVEAAGAKAMKFPGHAKHDFFIHKNGKVWNIREAKTGLRFAEGKTQKEAVEMAIQSLKVGTAKQPLQKTIDNAVAKAGLSPRYTRQSEKLPPHLQEVADRVEGVKRSDVTPKGYGPDMSIKTDAKIDYADPAKTPKELASRLDALSKFAQSQSILRRGMKSTVAAGSFQGKAKDVGPEGLIKLDQKTLLSDSDYVTTLAHELGHAIEHAVVGKTGNRKMKLFGDNIDDKTLKTLYDELLKVTEDVAPGGLKAKPEYYAKPAELIARFLEKMITSPSDLDAMAPTAVKMFEAQAVKHPIIQDFIGVAEGKLYNKKDIPKGQILPDLRETYQKQLNSKRLGNIAYGNYVSYRAMRERGKISIEKFMKERFKGVTDKPEDLFTAAEGIKVSRLGVPEFGTRSYNVARTPEEEISLKAAGWEKMPEPVWEGGTAYPQFAKWQYTPKDAKAAFDKLTPKGKQIILDFTAQRSEAKDYFNREMIQSANKIDRTIEGWVHHFWPGESSSTAVGGDRFRTKIAGTRKQRMGATGYVKDLNQAITKAMTDLEGEKVWNDFIGRHLAMVTRPLAEGQQPMKGWIEVQGDLKKGIGRPIERPKTVIIDKASGESFRPKVARYQMPLAIYKHYELIKDLADEATLPLKIVNYLQQYWQINTLFHAGTAATNFIGGGILFSNKVLHDMYLEGLTGDFKMPQTRANISAMFKVLMPHGWAKAPDWVYGSDLSNFYGQFMTKGIDPVQHGIDKVGDKALLAFGTIERYWKKVIMTSEGMSDVSKLNQMSKEGLKLPVKEEREMLAAINDTVDLYAFDYDNVSGALEQFRRNPVARGFKPYATYPYKYMKHVERLIRSVFDRTRPWQDRVATLMALSTLMAGYAYWSSERKKKQQTPEAQVESKIPARLQTRGRTFVATTEDGKELFARFGKYPYFGLSETGMQLAHGNMEAGRDALNDVVGSLGPFANLTMLAFGYRNKYNQYDPVPVVVGDVVGGYLPAYRVMNDISRYFDPYQRKQQTFGQAALGKYIPTTDEDLQNALHGKIRTEDVPEEGDIKGAEGKKTTIEYKLENYKEDILISALTGVYRSRLDPEIVKAYLIREEKNKEKREKKNVKKP